MNEGPPPYHAYDIHIYANKETKLRETQLNLELNPQQVAAIEEMEWLPFMKQ